MKVKFKNVGRNKVNFEREHKEEMEERVRELAKELKKDKFIPRNRAERRKAMKNRRNNANIKF